MNDLAERALHGLDVARRFVIARPVPWLAGAGLVAASMVVFVGGRIGAARAALPLDSWLGLLPRSGYRSEGRLPGILMFTGIAVLVGLWFVLLSVVARRVVRLRALWSVAVCWSLPFVVGPPLLGTDVFVAAARGVLARENLSPYHHGPAVIDVPLLANAIDPSRRSVPSTDGPLSGALTHLLATVASDNPLGIVVLLRAIAVLSLVTVGRLAVELAGTRRHAALVVTVLNPAALLYVVSGAHLEGLVSALLLGAFVRAGQRRWPDAIVLTCVAAGLKPVVLVAVVMVIAAHATGSRRGGAMRIALQDSAIAIVVLAACVFTVPHGLDFLGNIRAVTHDYTTFAPSSLLHDLVALIVHPASYDDLAAGARVTCVLAAATVVVALMVTARRRAIDRSVGYALLAVALLGPVLYPWFLVPALLCLAPTARGVLRDWLIALSAAACALSPAGFGGRAAQLMTLGGFALVLAWFVPRIVLRRRSVTKAERVSASALPAARRAPEPS